MAPLVLELVRGEDDQQRLRPLLVDVEQQLRIEDGRDLPAEVDDALHVFGRVGHARDRLALDDLLDVGDVEAVVLVAQRELEDADAVLGRRRVRRIGPAPGRRRRGRVLLGLQDLVGDGGLDRRLVGQFDAGRPCWGWAAAAPAVASGSDADS